MTVTDDGNTGHIMTLAGLVARHYGQALGHDIWLYEGEMSGRDDDFYPARFDALMVMLVHSGSASLGVDICRYHLGPDSVGILRPRSYLTEFIPGGTSPLKVTVIGCSQTMKDNIDTTLDDIMPLVIKAHMDPVIKLHRGGVDALRPYLDLLRTMAEQDPGHNDISRKAGCILKAALYELIDQRQSGPSSGLSGRGREISANFLHLLGQNFHMHRDVEFYASCLSITAKHLSAVLKSSFGHTAGDWIESYVVREAKILLSHTSLPVKEIASRLNFSSQAFFGKYFRHATGMTPTAYRHLNRHIPPLEQTDTTPRH